MQQNKPHDDFTPPRADDGLITYFGHIKPENLLPWGQNAMEKSYAPYSQRRVGVLLRTERGELADGCNVETMTYDGLCAVEVAMGRLFSGQPWADHKGELQRISDVVFMTEDLDPCDPATYVPNARNLEWLHKFGSRQTVLRFATPERGIAATHRLADFLPHIQPLPNIRAYYNDVSGFNRHLAEHQEITEGLDPFLHHQIRRNRLYAFAVHSAYRVGAVVEAYDPGATAKENASLHRFSGLNIEVSGNDGIHGETCAIGNMIMTLGPAAKINRLVLQGGNNASSPDDVCTPCGHCRQMIAEFAAPDMEMISTSERRALPGMTADQLLPSVFKFTK